ncbi:hypothetical protein [Stygiolobus caldivivus]|uniref:Uncharacterized protein n=1 Tax=Stygiolobus caldivivus TaxID=2824673 RepID=A0A8D5ZJN5_9CREN|nr:hypothetical protein [Stygiolobus caldivivus]BCU70367.1 hypothetical protein KN1_16640 [Stygiolobus caldivivus]
MKERIVNMDINSAYVELKRILLASGYTIKSEDYPKTISAERDTMKIMFYLYPQDSRTRIVATPLIYNPIYPGLALVVLNIFIIAMYFFMKNFRETYIGLFGITETYDPFKDILPLVLDVVYMFIALSVALISYEIYTYIKRDSLAEEVLKILP